MYELQLQLQLQLQNRNNTKVFYIFAKFFKFIIFKF